MCHQAGFWWKGAGGRKLSRRSGGHSGGLVGESGSVLLVCFVYSPFSLSLLLLFPLFAVLLNCPYPDPPVSACFFPFSSAPRQGEGQPCGTFVAGCSQNQNNHFPLYDRVAATTLGFLHDFQHSQVLICLSLSKNKLLMSDFCIMMLQPVAGTSYRRESENSVVPGRDQQYPCRPQPHSGHREIFREQRSFQSK